MGEMGAAMDDDLLRRRRRPLLQRDEGVRHLAPFLIRRRDHRRLAHRRVPVEHVLHLERADVLAPRDDDVLGAILDLGIAVGMEHGEIAGMEPPPGEGLARRLRVLEIALHHRIAAQHELAKASAIGGDGGEGFGIAHARLGQHGMRHALAGEEGGLFLERQGIAPLLPGIDHGGAVGLGQAIEVMDGEAERFHPRDHCRRRCGAAGDGVHPVRQGTALLVAGMDQHVEHHRRAAEMGHPVGGDLAENGGGLDAAQADMGAPGQRHRPGESPAIAVEHRQRPQIDAFRAEAEFEGERGGVEIGAAVMDHHALGIGGGARRVAQRDRRPFALRQGERHALALGGDP